MSYTKVDLSSPFKATKSTPAPPGGQPTSSPPKRRRENEPELLAPARSIRTLYYKESADDDNDYESDSDDEPPPPTPVKRKVVTYLASPSKRKRSHTPALSQQTKARELTCSEEEGCFHTKFMVHKKSKSRPTTIIMKIQIKCFLGVINQVSCQYKIQAYANLNTTCMPLYTFWSNVMSSCINIFVGAYYW